MHLERARSIEKLIIVGLIKVIVDRCENCNENTRRVNLKTKVDFFLTLTTEWKIELCCKEQSCMLVNFMCINHTDGARMVNNKRKTIYYLLSPNRNKIKSYPSPASLEKFPTDRYSLPLLLSNCWSLWLKLKTFFSSQPISKRFQVFVVVQW